MKVLADSNVLIDVLAQRHPFDRAARQFLIGCVMGDYDVWVSSSQVTDVNYVLTHGYEKNDETVRQSLTHLRKFVRVASLTEADVDDALASKWTDFEDACVFFVARHLKADYLVTRNKKDFAESSIPVLTPEEFLAMIQETRGFVYDEVTL